MHMLKSSTVESTNSNFTEHSNHSSDTTTTTTNATTPRTLFKILKKTLSRTSSSNSLSDSDNQQLSSTPSPASTSTALNKRHSTHANHHAHTQLYTLQKVPSPRASVYGTTAAGVKTIYSPTQPTSHKQQQHNISFSGHLGRRHTVGGGSHGGSHSKSRHPLKSKKSLPKMNASRTAHGVSANGPARSSTVTPPPLSLPENWEMRFDPTLAQFYYINTQSNEVQFDSPLEVIVSPTSSGSPPHSQVC
ncbi:unnamed protein product [Ambrosiozyma monospora]|uniref:Unnamed protein product n=1 Tax=Ambrosiozyma monospora TaxID=43982 RepID=A0A9W7DCR4_AMBMO|nr:unnamed protein product [Ambrosiozyma monospora]